MSKNEDNLITLIDEDGNEKTFEFLDLIELNDQQFVVLAPEDAVIENNEREIEILKVDDSEEEECYETVCNEETLIKVFEIYMEKKTIH